MHIFSLDSIKQLHNSNKITQLIQQNLDGKPQEKIIWHFEGIFLPEDFGKPPPKSKFGLVKIEKPKFI